MGRQCNYTFLSGCCNWISPKPFPCSVSVWYTLHLRHRGLLQKQPPLPHRKNPQKQPKIKCLPIYQLETVSTWQCIIITAGRSKPYHLSCGLWDIASQLCFLSRVFPGRLVLSLLKIATNPLVTTSIELEPQFGVIYISVLFFTS